MYQIKKLIVCLDQSPLDETLVKFASYVAKINKSNKVYFAHIIRNLHIPKEVLKEFPRLVDGMKNERKSQMKQTVEQNWDFSNRSEISYIVKEGQLATKVLKLTSEKSADMILVGRKESLSGSGVGVQRLARRASCSLLIIPEHSVPRIGKILVPSDFSDYSKDALEEAIFISERSGGNIEIVCQNVYTIPSGYHFTGKTRSEFAEIMQAHAEIKYQKFIRKIDTKGIKISALYTQDDDEDPVEDIIKKAMEIHADGIIIGAKGRTAATALFLGSVAERLIQLNDKLPLLVTRPKGKNSGILDYILEI